MILQLRRQPQGMRRGVYIGETTVPVRPLVGENWGEYVLLRFELSSNAHPNSSIKMPQWRYCLLSVSRSKEA